MEEKDNDEPRRSHNPLRHFDLFSGIGGFSLGMEATKQIKTIGFVEKDKFCQK